MSGYRGYHVDRAELLAAVEELQRLERRIEEAMEAADREVTRLHASWDGAAAQAQRSAHERWRRGCAEMHAGLGVMRRIAATAHANYSAAIAANIAMWAG